MFGRWGYFALAAIMFFSSCQATQAEAVCELNGDIEQQMHLPVTEWIDTSKPCKAVIIAVHGLTLYAGAFDDLAKHLVSDGLRVYALDMRGFGRWMKEGEKYGGDDAIHIGQSQTDLVNLVKAVHDRYPDKKHFFVGESQGTNLALWVIENHPDLTNGAILASPCFKTRVHPTPRWLLSFGKQLIHPNGVMNLEPYTRPYLSNDPVLTEKCDNDPLVNRDMTPAELVKCLVENKNAIKNAGKIPADYPILMIAGTEDGVFKSTALPEEVKKFGDAKVLSLHLLQGKGHLLLEHQPVNPEIGKLIDDWLAKQL